MNELKLISSLHKSTKRNYIERMFNQKAYCMKVAKRYDYNYWDGNRKYGYGGYKYIPGRWEIFAKSIIKRYRLNNYSKILDIGCGKGFVLYEIKKLLPKIKIIGIDISVYGIRNAKKEIKKFLYKQDLRKKLKFKKKEFDLVLSINTLHNLEINHLYNAILEIQRIGKKHFITVESYRNEKELFNLQCWALTCESFFSKTEWVWLFKKLKYTGDYEFIYFE